MTQRIQTNRFTTTLTRPPTTRPVGELAFNFADNQLSVIDPSPATRDVLAVRNHIASATFVQGDVVRQGTGLYQAKAGTPPRAFNATDWDQFFTFAGGALTGMLTLSGAPTAANHATTKTYVDTQVLAGGTLTGDLTLRGPPSTPLMAANKAYIDGGFLPLAGGTLTGSLSVGGTTPGAMYAPSVWTPTALSSGGSLSLACYLNAGGSGWAHAGTTLAAGVLGAATDHLILSVAPPGANAAAVTGFKTYTFDTGGIFTAPQEVQSQVFRTTVNGAYFWSSGTFTQLVFDTSLWALTYNRTTGALDYVRGSDAVSLLEVSPAGDLTIVGNGLKPGGGAWSATSDARIKQVDSAYGTGLAAVVALQPVVYRFKGNDGNAGNCEAAKNGTRFVGLIAQDAEPFMPELVTRTAGTVDGQPVSDLRMMDTSPLPFAFINAFREIDARLKALEAR